MPSKKAILDFITLSSKPPKLREIARAFDVQPRDRAALRRLLVEIGAAPINEIGAASPIPELCIFEITALDFDGIAIATPTDPSLRQSGFLAEINTITSRGNSPILGDHVLARITEATQTPAKAELMRILPKHTRQSYIYGRTFKSKGKWYIETSEKGPPRPVLLEIADTKLLKEDLLIKAELVKASDKYLRKAKFLDIIGNINEPESILALTMIEFNLTDGFSDEVQSQASDTKPISNTPREDLTQIPLITIDGADAKDFDDAIFAEPSSNGGWRLVIAIADVSHYVRQNTELDAEAQRRGNSVYLPSKVLPMLPESLSNGLCSLKPNEDRACLAVEIFLDKNGNKKSHRFIRGKLRSAARLTYDEVQSVYEGLFDEKQLKLENGTLHHLFAVYQCRKKLRHIRGTLELHLKERSITFSENNHPLEIEIRQQKEANELIEEFMILANICAAETLEEHHKTCVYRVHEPPSADKLADLALLADGMNIDLPETPNFTPKQFNLLLEKAPTDADRELLQNAILRCQSRANYAIENAGHYGLGLQRYAHFTSPIRRYSDLLVHRALIDACNVGADGMKQTSAEQISEICTHISGTEQIAAKAERRTIDRMANIILASYLGSEQAAKIIGITQSGLFASIADGRAEGFISRKSLPDDFYILDDKKTRLTGRHLGWQFMLGQTVQVMVTEISPISGNIALSWRSGGVMTTPTKDKRSKKSDRRKLSQKSSRTKKNMNRR